ncbi:MAG TPA: FISUMP domain-containing protein [Bacteroidales bacterium]|nr:FISUMP domain-containing protein [Bacteroidales bacterium]
MMTIAILVIIHPLTFATDSPLSASNREILILSLPALPLEDDFQCGDVNEDGFVNVLDIITMVNYIMGGNPSPFNMNTADINADSGINVLDVIAIVNIIMQVPGLPCGCVAPVTYEGYTYPTVQIGSQCWFRENLNAGTMIISDAGGQLQTDNGIIEKYCYNNLAVNCEVYGALYEWNEAMQYITEEGAQGICPYGWHIPTDEEWKILEGSSDSQYPVGDPIWDEEGTRGFDAGGNLKEAGTVHWNAPNTGATNTSGFTGLPGGARRIFFGDFEDLGNWGYFWTSTEEDLTYAWRRYLSHSETGSSRYFYHKNLGYSVRCLKGCWPQPTQANAGPDQLNVLGTMATMAANTPTYGSGVWSIVSGTGGTFVDPWSPSAEFQGMSGNEYLLSWTITTDCNTSADTVLISFSGGPFICGTPLIDPRDGQSYPTVQIGVLCWMAANLNIGTMITSNQSGQMQTNNGIIEKYCYGNTPAQCDVYGGLYEWDEAMQYVTDEGTQGICPEGWHIPTDEDWQLLEGTVDSQYPVGDPEWDDMLFRGFDAGGNLKETGFEHWSGPNLGATNSSGFTALPGGYRNPNSQFYGTESIGYFWSSTLITPTEALNRRLYWDNTMIGRFGAVKATGYTIRCLLNG